MPIVTSLLPFTAADAKSGDCCDRYSTVICKPSTWGVFFGSCSCIAHKSVGVIIKGRISVDKERIAQCRLLLVVSLRARSPNTR